MLTAIDARSRLRQLQAERSTAVETGLGANVVYMADLHDDIVAAHAMYIGLAITEVATLRAQLGGAQIG